MPSNPQDPAGGGRGTQAPGWGKAEGSWFGQPPGNAPGWGKAPRVPTEYLPAVGDAPQAGYPPNPAGPSGVPSPQSPRQQAFADESTEVYGDDGVQGTPQVKGKLAVLEGELAGHWFTLLGSEITIGRADDNHLIIPDLAASRHHLKLIWNQGAYRLQDRGSGNGTYVNGIRVEEAILRDGDQIEIGRTIMEFLTTDRPPGPVRFRRGQALMPPAGGTGRAATPPPQPRGTGSSVPARPPTMDFPSASYPGAAVTPMSLRRGTRPIPVWAMGLLGLLLLGMLVVGGLVGYHLLGPGSKPPEPSPFEKAQAAYQAGYWDEALELLGKVPPDAPEAAQARSMMESIQANAKLIEQAQDLKDGDELEQAAKLLEGIREGQPFYTQAADLLAEIKAEIRALEAAIPKGPDVAPGSPVDKALRPYRRERLSQSIGLLRRLARRDPLAKELAGKMSGLLKALRTAKTQLRRKKYEDAFETLERARILDLELGGALQGKILPRLLDTAAKLVAVHLEAKRYAKAGEVYAELRKVARKDPKVAAIRDELSRKAKELLSEAIQLKDVTPRRARRLMKAIVKMVPPNDPSHKKAAALLEKHSKAR